MPCQAADVGVQAYAPWTRVPGRRPPGPWPPHGRGITDEPLFVLAIRHALLLEELPSGDLPLKPAPLAATVREARAFIAEVVPFGALAGARACG